VRSLAKACPFPFLAGFFMRNILGKEKFQMAIVNHQITVKPPSMSVNRQTVKPYTHRYTADGGELT